jgi:ParB family transcriptional regulator, chromosome partitioning protein
MSALAVDKTTVSRMISVTTRIPPSVIDAIGPAPGIGRDRWMDLAGWLEKDSKAAACAALMESKTFEESDSDARFSLVLDLFLSNDAPQADKPSRGERPALRREVQQWGPSTKNGRVVSLTHNTRVAMLSIDQRSAPGFGEFLLSRMDQLYAEYSTAKEQGDRASTADQRGKKAVRFR